MVLLVRRSLVDSVDYVGRWFTDTPGLPSRHAESSYNRFALVATIDGVMYMATHLDEKSHEARAESIRRIAQWCHDRDGKHVIVLGDFNCDIDDHILEPLWSCGMRDALSHVPARGPSCTTHHSFTGTVDGNRIDHIIVSSDIRVVACSIVHRVSKRLFASDHWPVTATVKA